MDNVLIKIQSDLDSIKKIDKDLEYWSARELMPMLGYNKWQTFKEVIDKAKDACAISGYSCQDHFTDAGKLVLTGSTAQRQIDDILLTRYACYLIAQNGDSRKPQIALSQTYFAS